MKKVLLAFALIYFLPLSKISAQTFFIDSFTNQSLPGWTIVNDYAGASDVVWAWSTDPNSVGGAAGTFNGAGATNGHIRVDSDNFGVDGAPESTSITSSRISCLGKPGVLLNFTEFYAKYLADEGTVYVSNDSINWILVHTSSDGLTTNTTSANPNFVTENISIIAANRDSVYIRFSWVGSYDYYWFIDDVSLSVPPVADVEANELQNQLSNGCLLSNAENIKIVFTGRGLNTVDSVMAYYAVNGGVPVGEKVILPSSLSYGDSYTYTFTTTADFSVANTYFISGWVDMTNDNLHQNDTSFNIAISAASSTIPYTMGFEVPNIGNEIGGFTWTNEDVNVDDFSWYLSTASAHGGDVHFRYLYNGDGATSADDWLYSPCISLDAAKAYKLSFWSEVGEDGTGLYPEKLEVKMGTTNNSSSMAENIQDFGTLSNSAYEQQTAAFKPNSTSNYYLGFHCYSDADEWFLDVDDVNITELLKPTAVFTATPNGSSVNVTDASSEMITDWSWDWGDGATSQGQVVGPHTYATGGIKTICLIVTNLAGADTVCHDVTITGVGINQWDRSAEISIYPNPTNRILNVCLNDVLKGEAKIDIINILGETMLSRTTQTSSIERFDMGKLAQGVYYVRITSDGMKAVRKFVYTK